MDFQLLIVVYPLDLNNLLEGDLIVYNRGTHSHPKDIFHLGALFNSAMVGVFSKNQLEINGSTLRGFNTKNLIFVDYSSVCINPNYPNDGECYNTELAITQFLNIEVAHPEEEFNCSQEKNIQNILKVLYENNNLFLDNIGIEHKLNEYVLKTLFYDRQDIKYRENTVRYIDYL